MTQPSAPTRRLALLLLASVLAACSKPQPAPEPLRSVKVLAVAATAPSFSHEFAGEIRPRVESRLGFRVAGKIIQRHAEPGQRVQPGQVLALLDAQDYRLAADAARAQVVAAATQRDLAAADFRRFAVLKDQNFISGAELQRREASLKAAQAQLEQAQAQLASQSNQAGYTRLSADAPGVITGIEAEPGQVVSAGSPVVRIARDGARDVVFSVPEDKVTAIRPGSAVVVRLWAGGGAIEGQVREVAASADPVTRTYGVKVSLPADAQPPLGSTAYVAPQALSMAGTAVIKLPTSALRQQGQGSAVWVLDSASMTLRPQPVQIATADGNEAVVAAGLQPGMLVVSAGVHVLAEGQKVRIHQDRAVTAKEPAQAPMQPAVAAAAAVQPVAAR